jgi:apolipoprotein D and lipocalin family protein
MQFLWPFKAAYLIVYLDDNYKKTIIGVPTRKYVWIMSRDPDVSDAKYQELLDRVAAAGYDTERVQRVPQQWPSK